MIHKAYLWCVVQVVLVYKMHIIAYYHIKIRLRLFIRYLRGENIGLYYILTKPTSFFFEEDTEE